MIDFNNFKIKRGPSDVLKNPLLIIEEGCWYLSTDTAELYIGIIENDTPVLKRVNGDIVPEISFEGYATEDFVREAIASINIPEAEVYDDTELRNLINSKADANHLHEQYLTEHQDISHLATKAELPNIDGLASEAYVDEKVAGIIFPETDLSNYYTKEETYTKEEVNALLPHEEIEEVKTTVQTIVPTIEKVEVILPKVEEEVLPAVETVAELRAWVENKDYLQDIDLKDYAKSKTVVRQKYEVLPVEGMLISYRDSEVRLNTQRVIPTVQTVGETGNPNMYYVTFRAYAPEGATRVIEGQSDVLDKEFSSLATDSYGRKYTTIWAAIANTSNGGKTWTKWGDTSTLDKYLGFYYNFHWYNEDQLIETDKVRVILTNDNCHDDLVPDAVARRIDDKIKAIEIPSVDGLVSKDYVDNAIANIEHPTVDLSEYAKKEDIPTDYLKESDLEGYAKLEDVPEVDNFVTNDELNSKGYLTEHQNIEHKANNILFSSDMFVTKEFGNFKVGDTLKGMPLTEILTKLLGLSDVQSGDTPEQPEIPGENATPEEIINYLINNRVPMYSQDINGVLTETPFSSSVWTKQEAAVNMDGISTVYSIKDDSGTIIESGYQEATDYNEEAWLTVALPEQIKNVKVKMYVSEVNDWVELNWNVVPAEEQTIEGYTIWTVPEDYEVASGDTYRFVIV